jgi:lipid A ethanolaminephosphotransferase
MMKADDIKNTFKSVMGKTKAFLQTPQSIRKVCAILSLYTVIVFNIPTFRVVIDNINCNWNGVLLFSSVVILMFTLNWFIYSLLLWLGRAVGKGIIAFTFIGNSIALYFINVYNAWITDSMMGNVFNTRYSEASGFFSVTAVMYILFLGIPPCIYLFKQKINYGKILGFLTNILVPLLIIVIVLLANLHNILWIDKVSTPFGSRILPWSYIVNTVRYYNFEKERNRKAIILPDAEITTDSKDVCVLIIGESARRENFSLYGYRRNTNPLLAGDSVKTYIANSHDTYTTAGVKAILDHKETDELYEILPNYLFRNGVDVVWRSANWGEPPLHIEKYKNHKDLAEKYPEADGRYDGVLIAGLIEEIENNEKDKQLIVLHTSTSHGPKYFEKYPEEFKVFTPVCTSVEISSDDKEGLLNAYDNTILYTDYLIHSVIETLKQVTGKRCCMIFVSDHGESLGEDNVFMHGLPKDLAPKQQFEIPFIVWENDSCTKTKELDSVEQFHVFHSIMNWLGMRSTIYDDSKNIFEPVK